VSREASATRYAKAIFEIALERQELEKWQSDLEIIAIPAQDKTVSGFLESPSVHSGDKIKVMTAALQGISPVALNLVRLLVVKGRFSLSPEILLHYKQLLDEYRGIERAEVITAIPLSDDDKQKLETRLGAMINKKVIISPEVDESLLGGIVARMGGKLLDGSVRSKLENLKKEISGVSR
jgi:F-type H+-transporting ATPase subunit delta